MSPVRRERSPGGFIWLLPAWGGCGGNNRSEMEIFIARTGGEEPMDCQGERQI